MAATLAALANVRQNDDAGVRRKRIMSFAGDASYIAATGTIISAASVGLGYIEFFSMPIVSSGTAIYFVQNVYNSDGSVTLTFYSATGTAVGNSDLSTYLAVFEVSGR